MLYREFREQWAYSIFFSVVFAVISYFLQLGYFNYIEAAKQGAALANLYDRTLYTLRININNRSESPRGLDKPEESFIMLRRLIEKDLAFTHFETSSDMVVLGAFAEVFGITEVPLIENTVFFKNSYACADDARSHLDFGMKNIDVVSGGKLPEDILFLTGTFGVPIAKAQVVHLTAESFFEEYYPNLPDSRKLEVLGQIYRNLYMISDAGVLSSGGVLHEAPEEIAEVAAEAHMMGFSEPEPVYISAMLRSSADSSRDTVTTAFTFIFMLVCLLLGSVVVRCINTAGRLSREFKIHHYFGAVLGDLYCQIAAILAIQFLPSAVFVWAALPPGTVRTSLVVSLFAISALFSAYIVYRAVGTYNKSERI